MAPKKKAPAQQPTNQRRITSFFGIPGSEPAASSSRAASVAASAAAQTVSTACAGTSAATAGASSAGTAAAARSRGNAGACAGTVNAGSEQQSGAGQAVGSKATPNTHPAAPPRLSNQARVLTQQLQQAVEDVAAGNELGSATARFSRVAQAALGEQEHTLTEHMPQQQHQQDAASDWPQLLQQPQLQVHHQHQQCLNGLQAPQQLGQGQPSVQQHQHLQQAVPQWPPWPPQQQQQQPPWPPQQQHQQPWPPQQQQQQQQYQQQQPWPPQQQQQQQPWLPQHQQQYQQQQPWPPQHQQQQQQPWPPQHQQQQQQPWPPPQQQQQQQPWPPPQQQEQHQRGLSQQGQGLEFQQQGGGQQQHAHWQQQRHQPAAQQQWQQQQWPNGPQQHQHQYLHHKLQGHQQPPQQQQQQPSSLQWQQGLHGHRAPQSVSHQLVQEEAAVKAALRYAYTQVQCFQRLNEQQQRAASGHISRPLLILAGAGTGKTSTLIARVLYMLAQGVLPSRIMVVTFTNKAAGELKDRLFKAITEATSLATQQLAQQGLQVQLPVPESPEQLGVLACTFHSWCYRVLRARYRAAGFVQCPLVWDEKAARQAIRVAIRLAELDKVLSLLSKWLGTAEVSWPAVQAAAREKQPELMRKWQEQRDAAKQKAEADAEKKRKKAAGIKTKGSNKRKASGSGGPAAVAAGQTRMERFSRPAKQARLQEGSMGQQQPQQQQQQPGQVCGNSNPPPAPVQQQQQNGAAPGMQQPPPQQQHAEGDQEQQQLPQQQEVAADLQPNGEAAGAAGEGSGAAAVVLGGLQQQELQIDAKLHLYGLLKEKYDTNNEAKPAKQVAKKPGMRYVKQAQRTIDNMKCRGERPDEYLPEQAAVMQHYQRLLRLCNALDFNDLLDHCVRLLEGHAGILQQLQRQRPFLLVDEFQDSNKPQTDLVNLLQGKMQNVTVVGDDAQSIYSFRGAQPLVFEAYKAAYSHQDLVCPLERNYRSTPQILKVGKALLTGSGTMEKQLLPTVDGEGKPPVRLLVLDTEEDEATVIAQEAKKLHEEQGVPYKDMAVLFRVFNCGGAKTHSHLQKALTRVGVPFVLVKDVSLMERQEVKDVMAYVRLALNPSDDEAFMRVLNVPARRLGDKLQEQLEGQQQEALTALGVSRGLDLQQQQQQQHQQSVSLFSIAQRLLWQGDIGARHQKGLRGFMAVVEDLAGAAAGAHVHDLIELVLEKVPGLAQCIKDRKKKQRGQQRAEAKGEAEGEEKDADQDEADEEKGDEEKDAKQRQQQEEDTKAAGPQAPAAGGGSGGGCGGFTTAGAMHRQGQQQQQGAGVQQQEPRQHSGPSSSVATAATTHTTTAATGGADSDEEVDSSESGNESSDDESSEEEVAAPTGAAHVKPAVVNITPALSALYDEAVAFTQQYAAARGIHLMDAAEVASITAQPDAHGAAGSDAAGATGPHEGVVPEPAGAAETGGGPEKTAAAGATAAVEVVAADYAEAAAQQPPQHRGPPRLFDLLSNKVTQLWSPGQLVRAGVPRFLLEEIYVAMGKGERVVTEFVSHLALNPHQELERGTKQQQQQQGALTISTIHAAKGLEYNTCWVVRWCEGFMPSRVRKADLEQCKTPQEIAEKEEEHRREEQRLAHVAVTRAKERLILTRPRWAYLPRGLSQATPEELRQLLEELQIRAVLHGEEIRPSGFLTLLSSLDSSVLVEENRSRLPEYL